jgi:hypothetical protein
MKREQVLLAVVFAALAAVVLFNVAPGLIPVPPSKAPPDNSQTSSTPVNASVVSGPDYLMYNQPFFFAPPVQNFLPSTTAPGQAGAQVNAATPFGACNSCGG